MQGVSIKIGGSLIRRHAICYTTKELCSEIRSLKPKVECRLLGRRNASRHGYTGADRLGVRGIKLNTEKIIEDLVLKSSRLEPLD